ncbi:MAG: rod shape-determining protein MreC [Myxococcales bacterium]
MRSLLRRYREPIFVAFLLALPFTVFAVKAKQKLALNVFDRTVISMTAPVEKFIVWSVQGVQDEWHGYLALRSVREDNLRLRRDLMREKGQSSAFAETKAENDRLRRLLDYTDKQGPIRSLVAPVVAVGASPHSHVLRIARGSEEGVHRGMPVISPDGVVGTIALTTAHYADIQLIVSPTSAVPALNERTRARATVKGTGDLARCKLEYGQRTEEWHDGDLLRTAGTVGFFPQGMPIGRLVNVSKKPTGMFVSAEVVPVVDFARLDEVIVVLGSQDAAATGGNAFVNASSVGANQ